MNLQFIVSGLGLGSVYALSGVSLVVLYRASGTLNFAIGALGALGAHCTWTLMSLKYPAFLAIVVSIVVAAAGSLLYGRIVAPALSHRDRSVRAVSTLGFALVLLGLMGLIWGETIPRRLTLPSDAAYVELLSVRVNYTRILALALALGTVAAIALLLHKTRIGLAMRALASNRELGGILGIDTTRVDSMAWLISGAIAGASGLLLGDLVRLQPTFLTFLVIPAVAAALLGRLTSLAGTVVGGLVIGVVEGILTSFPEIASYRSASPFLIALLFVTLAGGSQSVRTSQ